MKVVSPPSPASVASYPTEEAARASLGGTVPLNRRVLPYQERDSSPNADGTNPNPKHPRLLFRYGGSTKGGGIVEVERGAGGQGGSAGVSVRSGQGQSARAGITGLNVAACRHVDRASAA